MPTLVPAVFHQPARNADDIVQDALREVLQRHLLLGLHLIIAADQVQDEDGRDWLGVPCHQAAELRLQGLFSPLKKGFLAQKSRGIEEAQGFCNHSRVFLHEVSLSVVFLTTVKYRMLRAPTTPVTKRLLRRIKYKNAWELLSLQVELQQISHPAQATEGRTRGT